RAGAQDMMSVCAPDISRHCSNVSRGRGRITACLIAYSDQVSAQCAAAVKAVAAQGSNNRLVPAGVRKMLGTGAPVTTPAACTADASSLCSNVSPGHDWTVACLYARSANLSSACSSALNGE